MSATVQINEYNGAGETKTANITNTNMGSVDSANLDPTANSIDQGNNSFEKVQTFEVTAMGGSSAVENFKVWRTGALGDGSPSHVTNARTSGYAGAESYVQPVDTVSTKATQAMPTSEPASANLGVGGSLTGQLTTTGETDRLYHQIQTGGGSTTGSTSTMNYQYDEIA
jgi:hypothetical protein